MYDGVIEAEEIGRVWDDEARAGDLTRLRHRFDPLLEDPGRPLDPDARRELDTLARIHDLDPCLSPAETWRTLRLLLAPPAARA